MGWEGVVTPAIAGCMHPPGSTMSGGVVGGGGRPVGLDGGSPSLLDPRLRAAE